MDVGSDKFFEIGKGLGEINMNKIYRYFISKTLLFILLSMVASITIAGDIEAGKTKAAMCVGCHGADGISFSPEIPNLAGQKSGYIVKAIKDFKTGARKNPMMQSMVASLSDVDAEDLAAYFASLK